MQSPEQAEKQLDEALRRALATPPISNEDILRRSKEPRPKYGVSSAMPDDSEQLLREQLFKARANIVVQLRDLSITHYGFRLNNRELVETLQTQLAEIDQLLGMSAEDNA